MFVRYTDYVDEEFKNKKNDNCLFGKVLGMSKDLIIYEGNALDELQPDFKAGIDSYLEGCLADGIYGRKEMARLYAYIKIKI